VKFQTDEVKIASADSYRCRTSCRWKTRQWRLGRRRHSACTRRHDGRREQHRSAVDSRL